MELAEPSAEYTRVSQGESIPEFVPEEDEDGAYDTVIGELVAGSLRLGMLKITQGTKRQNPEVGPLRVDSRICRVQHRQIRSLVLFHETIYFSLFRR